MPRRATKKESAAKSKKASTQTVTRVERMEDSKEQSAFERISDLFQRNQSFFNIILGGLIVVVLGVLLFNYFNKPTEDLVTPASQTEQQASGDVSKENLPGTYTIKEGDTLFSIAQNYYDDGFKYPEIVKENKLANENAIEVGQTVTIPKLDSTTTAQASAEPSATPSTDTAMVTASASPSDTVVDMAIPSSEPVSKGGTGGAVNETAWGTKIDSDTYTVQADDWLSKISGRAYGDVMMYQKIAQANNITDPDRIEVGTVLKIPR